MRCPECGDTGLYQVNREGTKTGCCGCDYEGPTSEFEAADKSEDAGLIDAECGNCGKENYDLDPDYLLNTDCRHCGVKALEWDEHEFDDYFEKKEWTTDDVKRAYHQGKQQGKQHGRWMERDTILDRLEKLEEKISDEDLTGATREMVIEAVFSRIREELKKNTVMNNER